MQLNQVLSARQLRAARSAARSGQYQLFLGAGASLGGANKHGPLPDAPTLVSLLAKRFPRAPISESDALPRAYQRALLTSSDDELWAVLKEIFGSSWHEEWFSMFTTLPWRKVWTLNVDDTFENSYRSVAPSSARKIRTISWDDPYAQTADLEIIHLHGHVAGTDPRRLVFSFSEYQVAAHENVVWANILASSLGSQPMVIIGARLLGDPDVEQLLMGNRPTANAPSIVVDPYISDGNAWELEQLGYLIYKDTAKNFYANWCEEFGFSVGEPYEPGFEDLIAAPQLSHLQTNYTIPPPRSHDYFGGDEPLWSDVVSRRVAYMPWMQRVVADLESWLNEPVVRPTMHIVYSERLNGLSSGLLQIAKEAIRRHVTVLAFNKSARLQEYKIIDVLRGRGPTLIVADEGADFADDFDRLLTAADNEDNIEIYILVGEAQNNDLRLEGRISESHVRGITHIARRMDRKMAVRIVDKLTEFGRLGMLEEISHKGKRMQHFRDRDVFSAMMDVEYSMGFRRRIEAEIKELSEQWMRHLILLVSAASRGGKRVELVEACTSIGRPPEQVIRSLKNNDHLGALVEYFNGFLYARQRGRIIESAVGLWGAQTTLQYLQEIIRRLASLATPRSLRERNRPALLVGYLMSYRNLKEIFGDVELEGFYENLREVFGGWSARYWEQRAIYAKSINHWAQAESFSARAVSIFDDAFTRTTHGTILINKATNLVAGRDSAWHQFYNRGEKQFEQAAQSDRAKGSAVNRITTFAYLHASVALLEELVEWHDEQPSAELRESTTVVLDYWKQTYVLLRKSLGTNEQLESVRRAEELSNRWHLVQKRFGVEI